jgi:hypothetical protein
MNALMRDTLEMWLASYSSVIPNLISGKIEILVYHLLLT